MRNVRSVWRQDWQANFNNPKGRLIVTAFRFTQFIRGDPSLRPSLWRIPSLIAYRLIIEWVLGVELPCKTQVGPGLQVFHGIGLVINDRSVLGEGVILRHGVTVGHTKPGGGCPIIGDLVDIGAYACILGPIHIGDRARIGAGAVVVQDVAAGVTVVGNPARPVVSDPF